MSENHRGWLWLCCLQKPRKLSFTSSLIFHGYCLPWILELIMALGEVVKQKSRKILKKVVRMDSMTLNWACSEMCWSRVLFMRICVGAPREAPSSLCSRRALLINDPSVFHTCCWSQTFLYSFSSSCLPWLCTYLTNCIPLEFYEKHINNQTD